MSKKKNERYQFGKVRGRENSWMEKERYNQGTRLKVLINIYRFHSMFIRSKYEKLNNSLKNF